MKHTAFLLLLLATAPRLSAQDWSTFGNAGTNASTNFIGTTDNVPLVFKANNTRIGRLDPSAMNVFFGRNTGLNTTAIGQENTAVGDQALLQNTNGRMNAAFGARVMGANTTGEQNAAFGINALAANTTGSSNAGFGSWSLQSNTTGGNNAAGGTLALSDNTTGSYNVALGASALAVNKAGSRGVAIGAEAMRYANGNSTAFNNLNVAIGYQCMYGSISLTANTGNRNTAIGYQTLVDYTTGNENTGVGTQALLIATTGSANTAVGNLALGSLTTGSNNTAIGRLANVSTGTLSNATALGSNTTVNASNKVRLGNSSVTVVEGQVPYTSPSDARFKRDVVEDVLGLSFILRLRPVSYTFDRAAFAKHVGEDVTGREAELQGLSQQRTVGFLAQEVEQSVERAGFQAFDAVHAPQGPTDNYGLAYAEFVVPLVKAVQELHAENVALRERLEKLERALMDTQPPQVLSVFPVPAHDAVTVKVGAADIGKQAVIELFDASGRLVLTRDVHALPASFDMELSPVKGPGAYVLSVRVQGEAARSVRVMVER